MIEGASSKPLLLAISALWMVVSVCRGSRHQDMFVYKVALLESYLDLSASPLKID